jgi:diacylglycerol kinase (ATP)
MNVVTVILNPSAGRGRGKQIKSQLSAALANAGLRFELLESQGSGHAIELARQARLTGSTTVVAAGGDGTVSEVMNGLVQATPPGEQVGRLAIMPIGSANDFCEMAGCPRTLPELTQALVAGTIRLIDLGNVIIQTETEQIQRYFGNNVGVGFEAQVTLESYRIRWLRGTLLYGLATLRALRSCPTPQMQTRWLTEHGTWQSLDQPTLLVSIGNSRRTGGGFYLTPDAEMDDGLFDIGIGYVKSRLHILWLLPRVLAGKHTTDPAVTMARSTRLEVTSTEPVPLHADGEVLTAAATKIAIDLQPRRLQVIVAANRQPS